MPERGGDGFGQAVKAKRLVIALGLGTGVVLLKRKLMV